MPRPTGINENTRNTHKCNPANIFIFSDTIPPTFQPRNSAHLRSQANETKHSSRNTHAFFAPLVHKRSIDLHDTTVYPNKRSLGYIRALNCTAYQGWLYKYFFLLVIFQGSHVISQLSTLIHRPFESLVNLDILGQEDPKFSKDIKIPKTLELAWGNVE